MKDSKDFKIPQEIITKEMSSKIPEDSPSIEPVPKIYDLYAKCGQDQVFRFKLSRDKEKELLEQLERIDPVRVNKLYVDSTSAKKTGKGHLEPVKTVQVLANAKATDVEGWGRTGMRAIADGKVAVIIMAGGQGTRLGSDRPKGEYNIKLPSGKCIFQLQAERILKLERLASSNDNKCEPRIMLYLMTSPMTHEATVRKLPLSNTHTHTHALEHAYRCKTGKQRITME